jgi:hypothetical protein
MEDTNPFLSSGPTEDTNPFMKGSVSASTSQAIQSGADPADLARAKAELGKKEYIGYCQSFVEQATGSGWQGSSATDAWNRAQNKVQGLQGVQPGDPVYFQDPNNPDGHVGIMDQGNNFVSATDNGVEENNLNDWIKLTGQTPLGYLPRIGGQYGSN